MIIIFLIFNFLITIFSIIPLWNFENTAINLLSDGNEYKYLTYLSIIDSTIIKVEKTILKIGDSITETNTIYIGDDDGIQIDWESLESIYHINDIIYICPQGKNHLNKYENGGFTEMIPDYFSYEEDWELLCYHQINKNYMFVSYLNKHNLIYVYKFDSNEWITNGATKIYNGLFDFKWTTDATNTENTVYPMKMIIYNNNKIRIIGHYLQLIMMVFIEKINIFKILLIL